MRRREFLGVLGGAAATLAVCTTVLNAADEKGFEKALLGHIMWSAFAQSFNLFSRSKRCRGLQAARFQERLRAALPGRGDAGRSVLEADESSRADIREQPSSANVLAGNQVIAGRFRQPQGPRRPDRGERADQACAAQHDVEPLVRFQRVLVERVKESRSPGVRRLAEFGRQFRHMKQRQKGPSLTRPAPAADRATTCEVRPGRRTT